MGTHSALLISAFFFVASTGASSVAAASGVTGFYRGAGEVGVPGASYLVFNPRDLGALDQPNGENTAATQLLTMLHAANAPSPTTGSYVLGNIKAKQLAFTGGGAQSGEMASASIGFGDAADLRSFFAGNGTFSVSFSGEPAAELSSLMHRAGWQSVCDNQLRSHWACCPMPGVECETICYFAE